MKSKRFILFSAPLLALILTVPSGWAEELTAPEMRGKQIYLQGTSPRGEAIMALVGQANTRLPARFMPCGSCHGRDGLGRPEGGVLPPNITWSNLTKPYGHSHPFGRTHDPFTEESLAAAITQGKDPAGNPLNPVMPRYEMAPQDLADLVAYLKRLEMDNDPGLTKSSIRIGVILPGSGQFAGAGRRAREVLAAYFDRLNAGGGLYNRKIHLVFAEAGNTAPAILAGAQGLIAEQQVFALIVALAATAGTELADLVKQERVPLIEPLLLFGGSGRAVNPFTFYLLAGSEEQAIALLNFAAEKWDAADVQVAIVHPPGEHGGALARRVAHQGAHQVWKDLKPVAYGGTPERAAHLVADLQARQVEVVLYLASGQGLSVFMQQAAQQGWRPRLLLPGAAAGSAVFNASSAFAQRIFLAYPTLPGDQSPVALAQLAALTGAEHPHPLEIMVLSVAKVFEEGLKRAGRNLSRDNLIAALETMSRFDTGLIPPVSFSRSQRVGVRGAYVVAFDLQADSFVGEAAWVAVK